MPPGNVTERTINTISNANNAGIRIFDARSIPPPTPAKTTKTVKAIKTAWKISGEVVSAIKVPKMSPSAAGSSTASAPVTDLIM